MVGFIRDNLPTIDLKALVGMPGLMVKVMTVLG